MLSPFRMVCGNFILPEPASYVFFYPFFILRNLLYLITNKHEFACNAGKVTEYEVKEHIDTIMVGFRGFSKEVSIVKWNDKNPVFDIRAWRVSDRDELRYPLRGITFSKEEFIKLREILNSIDVDCIDEYM